ncbi:hypothetical protein [Hymenobacter coccineus]|uniref:hypothetical protein n=1 Tax=Hymenobacter coccineus TaxID=1908235 RepID=UPI000F770218|nr:hypothetical protein [Hymenobacter coccineus]
MKSLLLLALYVLLIVCAACTNLDDPFEGVTADQVFTLEVKPRSGDTEAILSADGRSALECVVKLNDKVALYSRVVVTVASDDMMLSLTGATTGATGSLTLPFAGQQTSFYAIAPRNYQEEVRLSVSSGNVRTIATIKLREVLPNRVDVNPTLLRTAPGTPFSFTTTLVDTLLISRAVSGKLPVQFDVLSPAKAPRLPIGRSVAQADGSASVITTVALPDTGTFHYRARVLGVYSQPFTIKCQ